MVRGSLAGPKYSRDWVRVTDFALPSPEMVAHTTLLTGCHEDDVCVADWRCEGVVCIQAGDVGYSSGCVLRRHLMSASCNSVAGPGAMFVKTWQVST